MRRIRGIGLVELLITLALFSVVSLISFILLDRGISTWRKLMETQTADLQLSKAAERLKADLSLAPASQVRTTQVPASLAGASDGSAIWFLSAVDEDTGSVARKVDGTPFWQRNVLYYLVVPDGHSGLFGYNCAGGVGSRGFEGNCPHKVLLRKVIDSGVATDPTTDPATTEETLLTDVTPYLTRPVGYDVGPMGGEPGVKSISMPSNRLLWLEATIGKEPYWPSEVSVDLRATATKEVERRHKVGTVDLFDNTNTATLLISVTPEN